MTRLPLLLALACVLGAAEGILDDVTQGALRIAGPDGRTVECPLKHSDYRVEISGMVAQVELVQTFVNPRAEAIEAIYVFPLSHAAGINAMSMEVGGRRIVGALLKRADARQVYETAKAAGKTASILDQERPNLFTQTVGNIPPAGEVRIRIAYVEQVAYDDGAYQFHLPLVVGPRYIPGEAVGGAPRGSGRAADTDQVPDASRISPPVLKPGFRNGHEVAISLRLDAGIAIRDLASANHQVAVERPTLATAVVALRPDDAIPNKDFVLRYRVAGATPELSAVSHVGGEGGWLLLTLQPAAVAAALGQRQPRDLCFLVDVSGSMSGEPLAKVREAMRELLALAGPQDRIQMITFASATTTLFPDYLPVNQANIAAALAFTDNQHGGGGTEMLAGVRAVLDAPLETGRMRMAVMLTDGFIGNEKEIIANVGTQGSERIRFWCIGIGSSPNRYLIDGVAEAGGGMGVVLGLKDDSRQLADGLMRRIQHAQLDRLRLDWGGLPVGEVVPERLPPLWSGRPVVVCARFTGPGTGTVTMHGEAEGRALAIPLRLELPTQAPGNRALRTLWARHKLGELRLQTATGKGYDLEAAMTELSLNYGVMTEYTSFVAVDERIVNPGGATRQLNVAVPLPEGVSELALPVLELEQLRQMQPSGREEAVMDVEQGGAGAFMSIGAGGGGSGLFGSRSGGGRKRAVGRAGGSKGSESTVDAGLRFLKRHQGPDGAWDPTRYQDNCLEAPKCEAGAGGEDDTVMLTAQTVLVYLGAGYDHKTPNKYKPVVMKGLAWLCARQQPDGGLAGTVQAQACALAALAEAYAMTNDPGLQKPAQAAVERLLALRIAGVDAKPLAWGQAPNIDTAVTVQAVIALRSAAAGGLNIGDGLERARLWLDVVWKAVNPGWEKLDAYALASAFPAQWSPLGGGSGSAVEAGAAAAVFLGRRAADPLLGTLATAVLQGKPTERLNDLNRCYFGSLALFQVGGEHWKNWNQATRDALVGSQRKGDGCFDASWDPQVQPGQARERGRLQSTVSALLALEIYYAYAQVPKVPASAPVGK
jgi:Ca-activated chloride channel family protein